MRDEELPCASSRARKLFAGPIEFLKSAPQLQHLPVPTVPEIAFAGRSNVGKSSLINAVAGQTHLARASTEPGRTREINFFVADEKLRLVDLPGYGFAKRSQAQRAAWQKMLADYFQQRINLQTVFVLIDSRLSPQKIDLEFLAQLGEWGIPFNIVFTKADKNTQSETARNAKAFVNRMKEEWEYIPRTFITSTVKFTGRKDMLGYIEELNADFDPNAIAGLSPS